MNTQEIYKEALALYERADEAAGQLPPVSKGSAEQWKIASGVLRPMRLEDEPVGEFLLGDNLALMKALAAAPDIPPAQLVYMDPPYFTNRERKNGKRLADAVANEKWRTDATADGKRLADAAANEKQLADASADEKRLADAAAGEEVRTAQITAAGSGGAQTARATSFSDRWPGQGGAQNFEAAITEYLTQLTARLIAARALLADDGCLWVHLDRHAVHYVKIMADAVFGGPEHLVNEVVWTYKSGGASARRFSNKHDTLLFYAKDKKRYKFFPQEEKSYNRGLKPYRFKGVKEWRDEMGWYTMVHMKDVWEIPMVGRTAAERTGYATQKPEALLERIVRACTEEGDLCLDPYAGSGTLGAVCARLARPYILIDENPLAAEVAERRLKTQNRIRL